MLRPHWLREAPRPPRGSEQGGGEGLAPCPPRGGRLLLQPVPRHSCLKDFSDLFSHTNDASSHHTPLKYFMHFAKSGSAANETLKLPNRLQSPSSAGEAQRPPQTGASLTDNPFNSPRSHASSSATIREYNSLGKKETT